MLQMLVSILSASVFSKFLFSHLSWKFQSRQTYSLANVLCSLQCMPKVPSCYQYPLGADSDPGPSSPCLARNPILQLSNTVVTQFCMGSKLLHESTLLRDELAAFIHTSS